MRRPEEVEQALNYLVRLEDENRIEMGMHRTLTALLKYIELLERVIFENSPLPLIKEQSDETS